MVLLWFFLIVPALLERLFSVPRHADTRLTSAMVAFALFQAAYYAEIIRAGIQSVPSGQIGAALALGMTWGKAMRLVILPQAFRNMTPLLLTQSVILFQDTSLVYVSALADFFGAAQKVGDRDGRLVEMLLFAGAVYFVVSYAASYAREALPDQRQARHDDLDPERQQVLRHGFQALKDCTTRSRRAR